MGASTNLGVPVAENDQDVFPRDFLDSSVESQVEILYFLICVIWRCSVDLYYGQFEGWCIRFDADDSARYVLAM